MVYASSPFDLSELSAALETVEVEEEDGLGGKEGYDVVWNHLQNKAVRTVSASEATMELTEVAVNVVNSVPVVEESIVSTAEHVVSKEDRNEAESSSSTKHKRTRLC